MDNFIQGRRKAVWISEKASLLEDAKRDWKDLGGNPDDVIDMKNPKLLKTGIQAESGIVFAPYTTLRSQKEARLKKEQECQKTEQEPEQKAEQEQKAGETHG